MHVSGHASGVSVPEQQIEREGLFAHQVIVDHERPDQIIGPQHRKRSGHLGAFEITTLTHFFFKARNLFFVDEDAEFSWFLEIDQRSEECRAGDPVVAFFRHVGQRDGRHGAANAIPDDVDFICVGGLTGGTDGSDRTIEHVIFESFHRELFIGIYP